jgi:RNase P/RNase MRP subunit p30
MIINTTNLDEIRKQIQKLKKENQLIVIKAQDEEFNKKIFEIPGVNVLLSPEIHNRKEPLKQRDSGLNEHLCRLAKENNVKIGIDINEIQRLDKKEKARTLARIMQNIQLCKRTGTQIIFYPEKQYKKQDVLSFFLSLKGSTNMARNAVEN